MIRKRKFQLLFIVLFCCVANGQEIIKILEDTPIYSEANLNSRVIAFAEEGEEARLLGYENSFYLIHYSSFGREYNGHIHQSKVSLIKKPEA